MCSKADLSVSPSQRHVQGLASLYPLMAFLSVITQESGPPYEAMRMWGPGGDLNVKPFGELV